MLQKAKLEGMRSGGEFFTSSSINQQAEKVKQLQKEWDAVQKKVESYDASIEKTNIALNLTKERAGDIQKQLASSGPNTEIMSQAMERMQKSAGKVFHETTRSGTKRVDFYGDLSGTCLSARMVRKGH